jgi:hypothetical protein
MVNVVLRQRLTLVIYSLQRKTHIAPANTTTGTPDEFTSQTLERRLGVGPRDAL